jgi:hypothetical protein
MIWIMNQVKLKGENCSFNAEGISWKVAGIEEIYGD